MAVNYNTDGITLTHDSKYNYVVVNNLKYKSGYCRKWVLASRGEELSDDELYVKFFEMLERGEIRTRKGKGAVRVLCRKPDGTYFLKFVENAEPQVVSLPKPIVGNGKNNNSDSKAVIANPESDEAKALIGKDVEFSMMYSMKDAKVGRLMSIRACFSTPYTVRMSDGSLKSGIFIKPYERKDEPLELAKAEVRASLHGKWIVSKDGKSEFMVTRITNDGSGWKVNGISAMCLMRDWTFEDGSPIVSIA